MENNRIEEIAPVIFWSIEEAGDGRLKVSTLIPPLIKENKQMLTHKVDLQREAHKAFNLSYYREVKTGQLRMLFISEGLARKGVSTLINTVMADPNISQRLYLVIFKGNFEEYIRNELDSQPNVDYFLYRMFKHYEEKKSRGTHRSQFASICEKAVLPGFGPCYASVQSGQRPFQVRRDGCVQARQIGWSSPRYGRSNIPARRQPPLS